MIDLDRTIDRAAARLTHAEPRPDVRGRVLASIDAAPRSLRWPMRRGLVLAGAGAIAALGAVLITPAWRQAHIAPPNPATRSASSTPASAVATPARTAAPVQASTTPATTRTAAKKHVSPPAPEYVTPTPLPAVAIDAIDEPAQIQPTPLSIPQLIRQPIAPGSVSTTVLDENGGSRER
jgi:hypothetical protein